MTGQGLSFNTVRNFVRGAKVAEKFELVATELKNSPRVVSVVKG